MTTIPPLFEDRSQSLAQPSPDIGSAGISVNLKQCIEPGTGLAQVLGYLVAILGVLIGGALSYGILWLLLLLAPLFDYFNRKKAMALIRGSGIEVGPHQFPQLYACAMHHSERLGLAAPPAIFIVE